MKKNTIEIAGNRAKAALLAGIGDPLPISNTFEIRNAPPGINLDKIDTSTHVGPRTSHRSAADKKRGKQSKKSRKRNRPKK
jgi:hypothetical protein